MFTMEDLFVMSEYLASLSKEEFDQAASQAKETIDDLLNEIPIPNEELWKRANRVLLNVIYVAYNSIGISSSHQEEMEIAPQEHFYFDYTDENGNTIPFNQTLYPQILTEILLYYIVDPRAMPMKTYNLLERGHKKMTARFNFGNSHNDIRSHLCFLYVNSDNHPRGTMLKKDATVS